MNQANAAAGGARRAPRRTVRNGGLPGPPGARPAQLARAGWRLVRSEGH